MKAGFYVAGIETKFAGSSCNDLVTSDGAGSTIISGHFDQRIRFWDTRAESSSNDILLEGKVTSLDLSRGKQTHRELIIIPKYVLYNKLYKKQSKIFI